MVRRPSTVLVVDDDPGVRFLCRVSLEGDGHRVLEAGSVETARQALDAEPVDIVLLDVHLGADDGRRLLASIQTMQPGIAVALLTGRAAPAVDGVDAVVRKPFELAELTAAVRRLSGLHARVG